MILNYMRLYTLFGAQGHLCYRWWSSDEQAVLTFTNPKTAKAWLREARKRAAKASHAPLDVEVSSITALPEHLRLTINPSDDESEIDRIVRHSFYTKW